MDVTCEFFFLKLFWRRPEKRILQISARITNEYFLIRNMRDYETILLIDRY